MAFKKLEFFVKPSSTITVAQMTTSVVASLNSAQLATTNVQSEGVYKDDYFAGIFDSRDNKTYMAFSDIAKTKYELDSSLVETTPTGGSVDLSSYATIAYVDSEVDGISSGVSTYVIE